MSNIALSGNASGTGTFTLASPNSNSDRTLNLPDGDGAVPLIKLETAVTASGTAVDFTGIPSWVKRITVMFSGVSTNGTSVMQVQIGAGSITNTGYVSGSSSINGTNATSISSLTSGFVLFPATAAANLHNGHMVLTLIGSNSWVVSGVFGLSNGVNAMNQGRVTLSDTLTQVRITTVNGTDNFDAGTVNILLEG